MLEKCMFFDMRKIILTSASVDELREYLNLIINYGDGE